MTYCLFFLFKIMIIYGQFSNKCNQVQFSNFGYNDVDIYIDNCSDLYMHIGMDIKTQIWRGYSLLLDGSGRTAWRRGSGGQSIVGNVILHDKLQYWQGKEGVHYHQGNCQSFSFVCQYSDSSSI